jgi:zinc transport system ATP-binding protein
MQTLLRLSGAAFGYGQDPVVSGVELEIGAGDFLGIVGPNGAGKTTLFRGMLGLIGPLAGRVELLARSIGYVPQRDTLDPIFPLQVAEVVHMGAYGRLSGMRRLRAADRRLAAEILERVGLAEHAGAPFASLSGGQRQRTLIARALMVRPQILLLDEPTSGVDRAAQRAILELLLELNREGVAVLLVSHQLGLVREAVQKVLWVADGRVRAGRPEELLGPEHLDQLFFADGEAGLDSPVRSALRTKEI